jgi:hypothetical protein
MTTVIFAGPSIYGVPRSYFDGFTVVPPAECGDVARAARDGAQIIGIIDGFFEATASVWHKELLWALSRGARLAGSSSIGALRAAEMWPWGMEGVGLVYRLYRRGSIADDDEVALLHGPPETGFVPLTEAMVNIRVTLRGARRSGVISADAEKMIASVAKSIYYKERTLDRILQASGDRMEPKTNMAELGCKLRQFHRDVKREDAVLLLSELRSQPTNPRNSPPEFPGTSFWKVFEDKYL